MSITARMDPEIERAIALISDDAWATTDYTDAILDETSGKWISSADVAEIPSTAFSSRKISEHMVNSSGCRTTSKARA